MKSTLKLRNFPHSKETKHLPMEIKGQAERKVQNPRLYFRRFIPDRVQSNDLIAEIQPSQDGSQGISLWRGSNFQDFHFRLKYGKHKSHVFARTKTVMSWLTHGQARAASTRRKFAVVFLDKTTYGLFLSLSAGPKRPQSFSCILFLRTCFLIQPFFFLLSLP